MTRTFSITKIANTITFPTLPNTPITSPPPTPAATASSGLPVSYASNSPTICTIAGSTISFVAAGTCSITASQAGNATYAAAAAVTRTFSITKIANTITFPALAQHAHHQSAADAGGDRELRPPSQLRLELAHDLHHSRFDDQLRCGRNLLDHRLAGRQRHLRRGDDGHPDVQYHKDRQHDHFSDAAQHAYSPVRRRRRRRPRARASQSATPRTRPRSAPSPARRSASSRPEPARSPPRRPATPPTLAATSVTRSFSITAGVNTITFPALPNTPFTSAPPTPAATASSGLPVSYASTTTGVCTIAGSTISFVAAGTCSITASQAGNATYAPATPVTQILQRHPRRQHDHLSGASQHPVHQRPANAGGDGQFGPAGQLRLDHDRRVHHRRLDDQLRRGGNLLDHRLAGRRRHLRRATSVTRILQRHPRRQHDHLSGASQHPLHQPAADAGGDGQFGPSSQLRLDHDRRVHHRRLDDQLRLGGNLLDHRLAGRQRHLRPGDPGDPSLQRHPRRQHDHLSGASQHALHQRRRRRRRRPPVRAFRSATPRPRPASAPSPARRSASSRREPARSPPRRPATPPTPPRPR